MIKVQNIWGRSESGLAIPIGRISDTASASRTDYLAIRNKAQQLEQLFEDAGVRIPPASELDRLIDNAKDLWTNWFLDAREKLTYDAFFRVMHLDRIADAVLSIRAVPNRADYLRALLSGSLNFFERQTSRAKNIFWELEVCARLLRRGADARLEEPPDVTVSYQDLRIGIACKKLYSEGHVQNVLSEAVRQIESEFDFGVVAINLDDLLPGDVVLKRSSSEEVAERLREENARFLSRHQRHLRKYLAQGRLVSAIVSTSIIADVPTEKPQFRNTYQWTVWTLPGIDVRSRGAIDRFYASVMARSTDAQ